MTCLTRPAISISFTNGEEIWECTFDAFTTEPRQYVDNLDFSFSTSGATIQQGNSRITRRTWAIASFVDKETGFVLEDLYRAWDTYRAAGFASTVAITDGTRLKNPSVPIQTSVVFTATPTYEARPGLLQLVSFGMTEV